MRHLLDLSDLMEEEFAQVYQSEKLLEPFFVQLRQRIDYVPLMEWINAYQTICESHVSRLEDILSGMFIRLNPAKTSFIESIIDNYTSELKRTPDEEIQQEEAILALYRLIHYKIAAYSTLVIHTKSLKLWEEFAEVDRLLAEEKDLEHSLSLLTEEHNLFLDNWYA